MMIKNNGSLVICLSKFLFTMIVTKQTATVAIVTQALTLIGNGIENASNWVNITSAIVLLSLVFVDSAEFIAER
jgi:hypothetical protein